MMSTISLRLNEKEDTLIRKYAELHHMELSTFIRQTIIEKIEDEYDFTLFNKVWEEEQGLESVSHNKAKKELGL
ncbi:MAG: CopG family transcriptional regulator [Peptostreptococcaceae bacterium]|nr:CopG family transcriptional regulator [Peptostreptococcaceae bacterium]